MKRGAPLKRKSKLAPGPGPRRTAIKFKRTPGATGTLRDALVNWGKPRKALKKHGARARRAAPALEAFRKAVLERAGGKCERCGGVSHPVYGPRLEAHHRLSRARGGKHDPANGVCLCVPCHRAVTDQIAPDYRDWLVSTAPRK